MATAFGPPLSMLAPIKVFLVNFASRCFLLVRNLGFLHTDIYYLTSIVLIELIRRNIILVGDY